MYPYYQLLDKKAKMCYINLLLLAKQSQNNRRVTRNVGLVFWLSSRPLGWEEQREHGEDHPLRVPRPDRPFFPVRGRLRDPRTAGKPLANWRTLVKWEASVQCASLPFLIIFLN